MNLTAAKNTRSIGSGQPLILDRFGHDPSLVLYLPLYRLDGDSFMSQEIPYGHLCTVTGATWRLQGRDFTADKIALGNIGINSLVGLTFVQWVKTSTSGATNEKCFMGCGINTSRKIGFALNNAGGGKVAATIENTANNASVSVSSVNVVNDGSWHLIGARLLDSTLSVLFDLYAPVSVGAFANTNSNMDSTDIGNYPYLGRGGIFEGGTIWIFKKGISNSEWEQLYLATKWRYK